MAVTLNARGTSVPFFMIGKNGTTLYQGSTDPSGTYTIKSGDYWLDGSNNSLTVWTSGAWAAPALGSLNSPTGSGSSGQPLSTHCAGVLSWTSAGAGSVTSASLVSANGFAGTVATSTTTPAITLTTSVTGLLKGNGTAISAATAGTDYSAGTSALGTGILKSTTSTGALTIAIAADFPTLNQSITGNAPTATNIAGGTAGNIVYQSGANTTSFLTTGTSSQVLVSGD